MARAKYGYTLRQADYSGIPDDPTVEQRLREQFEQAIREAAVSGVVEKYYDALPNAVKTVYSFACFQRNVAKVQ